MSQSVTREDDINSRTSACSNLTMSDDPCLNTSNTKTQYLKEINSLGFGKVIFTYSHKLGMNKNMDKLDKVSIFDENTRLIKEQLFEYKSYESTDIRNILIHSSMSKSYHSKRYFLHKVTEKTRTGLLKPSHIFEYNKPEELPNRFTASQDYWGYYNGKKNNFNLIDQKTLQSVAGNYVLANALNTFKAANREPDFNYGNKGILTKVIYPTGGYNNLFYEPHSYANDVIILPPITTQTAAVYNSSGSSFDEFTTSIIPFNQDADIDFIFDIDEMLELNKTAGGTIDPLTFRVFVTDVTTNQPAEIHERVGSFEFIRANPFVVTKDNFNKDYFVRLFTGHSYKISVIVNRADTSGESRLYYYNINGTPSSANIEVGGSRIAKIETSDNDGNLQTKNYHYSALTDLTKSSGKLLNRNSDPMVTQNKLTVDRNCFRCLPASCTTSTLFSNSAFPIYGVYHIGYSSVVEEYGVDFKGGGVETIFNATVLKAPNFHVLGDEIQGIPLANIFQFGKQLKKSTFKKVETEGIGNGYITLSESENIYKHDLQLDKEISIYFVSEKEIDLATYIKSYVSEIKRFNITGSSFLREWHYLEKTINTQYNQDGLNPLITQINYYYDNPDHLQLTRQDTNTSNFNKIITEHIYPEDISISDRTIAEQILIDQHRIATPIQTETIVSTSDENGTTVLSKTLQRTNYKDFGNNLILPETIQTLKGEPTATNTLEPRIIYHDYDDFGNPLEVSKTDGTHIVYIWGYNHSQPIAKIENATYAQVLSHVPNLQTKSNSDTHRSVDTINENGVKIYANDSEGNLREALDGLRDTLPNALVTTYTYDPLIGVTSMTDSRGSSVYYNYDGFNRLKHVKDQDGNILSKSDYNYRPQN